MITLVALVALSASPPPAPPLPLWDLLRVAAPTGREGALMDTIVRFKLDGLHVARDAFGSVIVTRAPLGDGVKRVVAVGVDEWAYVVTRIRDDGYLRVKVTERVRHRQHHAMHEGRPVRVHLRDGTVLPGVIPVDSIHLRGARPTQLGEEHLFVDVGAGSPSDVKAMGIRLLDAVTMREFVVWGDAIAGPGVTRRAIVATLLASMRAAGKDAFPPDLAVVFVAQSLPGRPPLGRGWEGVLQRLKPEQALVIAPGDSPDGPFRVRDGSRGTPRLTTMFVRSENRRTTVERVTAADLSAVGQEITRRLFGDGAAKPEPVQLPPSRVYAQEGAAPNADGHEDAAETLAGLVAVSGVSGHEQGVFATLRFLLARHLQGQGMARDDAGNLVVTIGKGKRTVVFVAHMDEVGFVITKLRDDGFCEVRRRGGFYPHLYTWTAMDVVTKRGVRPAISIEADGRTLVDLGVRSKAALEAMGIAVGQPATVPKEFLRLGPHRATGRSFDDRVGCAALVMALKKLDRDKLDRRVVFAWVTREEIGLEGADHLAKTLRPKPDVVFPVDTFVSSDSPRDDPRFAFARIGGGPVLRAWDNSSITSPLVLDRVRALADGIPLQVGMVGGGNDGSRFVPHGVVNCPLAWPQRCSHSRVETMDLRDLEALADLVARIAVGY